MGVPLTEAREVALAMRNNAKAGGDPLAERPMDLRIASYGYRAAFRD
ncbi:MAG: hypothetical protein ACR2RF_00865 [Geminicoccaceae bacterium]